MVKINQAQIHTNQPKNVTLIIMSQRCVLFKGLLFYCLSHTTHTHIVFTNKEAPRPELHVGINFKLTLNTVLTATTTTKKNASYTPSKREMTLFLLLHLIWGCLYRELKGEGARAERGRSYGSYVRSLRKVKSDRRRKKRKKQKKWGLRGGTKKNKQPHLCWSDVVQLEHFFSFSGSRQVGMDVLTDGRTAPPGRDGRPLRQSCRCRLRADGCLMSSGWRRIPAGPLPLRLRRLREHRSAREAGPPIPAGGEMMKTILLASFACELDYLVNSPSRALARCFYSTTAS